MSKKIGIAAMLIAAVMMLFASCEGNPKPASNGLVDVTVALSDSTMSKTIGFDGDGALNDATKITHWDIFLYNATGETDTSCGGTEVAKLKKTDATKEEFVINDLTTGWYTFKVEGFIAMDDANAEADTGYTKIASTVQTEYLSPESDKVTINVDDFIADTKSGDITVKLTMPQDLMDDEGTFHGTLGYKIFNIDETDFVAGTPVAQNDNVSVTATKVDQTDLYSFNLEIEGQDPGVYILVVTATGTGNAQNTYSNADVLRLLPTLPATGEMNLNSLKPDEYPFTVTDGIGGELEFSTDADAYTATEGNVTINVTSDVAEGYQIMWFIDGEKAVQDTDYTVSEKAYSFTGLESGLRNITGIVYDDSLKAAVGSYSINVTVAPEVTIEPVTEAGGGV